MDAQPAHEGQNQANHGPHCHLPWTRPYHPRCRTCQCCPGLIRKARGATQSPWVCYTCAIADGVQIPRLADLEQELRDLTKELQDWSRVADVLGVDPKHNADLNRDIMTLAYRYKDVKLEFDCLSFLDAVGPLPETMFCVRRAIPLPVEGFAVGAF